MKIKKGKVIINIKKFKMKGCCDCFLSYLQTLIKEKVKINTPMSTLKLSKAGAEVKVSLNNKKSLGVKGEDRYASFLILIKLSKRQKNKKNMIENLNFFVMQ